MNKRKFIKSSVILIGLSLTNPEQFLKHITGLYKLKKSQPLSWKDKILDLYSDRDSPLLDLMKNSKPVGDPHFLWWKDTLR
jgi:hypothetical protein